MIACQYMMFYGLYMLTVGKRIAAFRKRQGLSQLQLAVSCDPILTQGAISHLETGVRPGRWDTLYRVATALKINVEDLFRPQPIPVIAIGRAGPEGYSLDEHPPGGGFDYLERPLDVEHANAYGIEVEGDSMIPTLYPKWKIIVVPERPRSRSLAVVGLLDGQRLIKTVRYSHGRVLLDSSNPAYEPIVVASEEIVFIHRIAWIKPSQTD